MSQKTSLLKHAILGPGDCIVSVWACDSFRIGQNGEEVNTAAIFIVRRHSGLCDIIGVCKTATGGESLSPHVHCKEGIPKENLADEVEAAKSGMVAGVMIMAGVSLEWKELDLSGIEGRKQRAERIRSWMHMRPCLLQTSASEAGYR